MRKVRKLTLESGEYSSWTVVLETESPSGKPQKLRVASIDYVGDKSEENKPYQLRHSFERFGFHNDIRVASSEAGLATMQGILCRIFTKISQEVEEPCQTDPNF